VRGRGAGGTDRGATWPLLAPSVVGDLAGANPGGGGTGVPGGGTGVAGAPDRDAYGGCEPPPPGYDDDDAGGGGVGIPGRDAYGGVGAPAG
jgi:hypothetical protein